MDASSSSSRPRQRTFTSCTECRRRKQKCNQAKSPRKCSNCERRWPPVECTYSESSSPPPPSSGYHYDQREDAVMRPGPDHYLNSNPSYVRQTTATSPSTTSGYHANAASDYYIPTSECYNPSTTRSDYGTSSYDVPSSHSSIQQYSSVPSTGGFASTADATYYTNNNIDYSSPGSSTGGYMPTEYYTTNGDPAAFVGATSGEYTYYPDLNDYPSTTRS